MTVVADRESGLSLASREDRRLTRAALTAHASGALTVAIFLIFLLPATRSSHSGFGAVVMRSAIALALYLPIATWAADRWLRRGRFATIRAWLLAERPPTVHERDVVLRYPLSAATVGALLWILAAALFSSLGTAASPVIALSIGVTVILGGLSTCA